MFVGGLEVEEAECQHRCRLEGQFARARETRTVLPGAVGPGDGEVRDVLAIDLVEAREVLAERVAAVVAPVAGVGRLSERRATRRRPRTADGRYNYGTARVREVLKRSPQGRVSVAACWYSCAVISPRAVMPRLGVFGVYLSRLSWLAASASPSRQQAPLTPPLRPPLRLPIGPVSASSCRVAVRVASPISGY